MDPACRKISRLILPAIRASIAEIMSKQYRYKQEEIADKLGIVQVAVSKYLNNKYSPDIERLKDYILERKLSDSIADDIARGKPEDEIGTEIDRLCGNLADTLPSLR